MVGDLDPRYDKRGVGGRGANYESRDTTVGVGEVYTSGTILKAGGRGSCLAEEGEVPYMKGQLYDLLNSERFIQLIITTSEIRSANILGVKAPPPPVPPFPY